MAEPIVYVDSSEIRDGRLEEVKTVMNELVEFVKANEPELIAYNVYLNVDNTRMTVIHVHRDTASLEFHMRTAGALFPKFAEFITLVTIDIYGKPTDELIEQMRQKAKMLGNGSVRVHGLQAGFARFPIQ